MALKSRDFVRLGEGLDNLDKRIEQQAANIPARDYIAVKNAVSHYYHLISIFLKKVDADHHRLTGRIQDLYTDRVKAQEQIKDLYDRQSMYDSLEEARPPQRQTTQPSRSNHNQSSPVAPQDEATKQSVTNRYVGGQAQSPKASPNGKRFSDTNNDAVDTFDQSVKNSEGAWSQDGENSNDNNSGTGNLFSVQEESDSSSASSQQDANQIFSPSDSESSQTASSSSNSAEDSQKASGDSSEGTDRQTSSSSKSDITRTHISQYINSK